MDYMNLGIKSRKTGISVKDNIPKDEFDMENIDEFFKDKTSIPSIKKKTPTFAESPRQQRLLSSRFDQSRRQSSLFKFNNYNELSPPHIMSPSIHRTSLSNNNTTHNFTSDVLHSIREDDEPYGRNHSSAHTMKRQRLNNLSSRISNYKTSYGFSVTPTTNGSKISHNKTPSMPLHISNDLENESVRYNKRKDGNNSWLNYDSNPYLQGEDVESDDAPDLTTTEFTVNNTSLVTSDDARLESEVSSDELYAAAESELSSGEEDNDDIIQDNIMLQQEGEWDVDATYIPSSPISSTRVREHVFDEEQDETQPVRRSDRIKIPTLDYWRNEKIVYQRKNQSPALDIVKIVTYDDDKVPNLKDDGRENNKLDNTTEFEYDSDVSKQAEGLTNENASRHNNKQFRLKKNVVKDTRNGSWLKDGEFKANVFKNKKSFASAPETVAYAPGTYQMEKVKQNNSEKYSLAIIFDKHKDLFASGMLKIPNGGKRTVTSSQNAFITFYMIRGILEVMLNKQKFIVTSGSTFQVPAFNSYAFRNKGYQEVQLFFVQVMVSENFNELSSKKSLEKDKTGRQDSHNNAPMSSSPACSANSLRSSSLSS